MTSKLDVGLFHRHPDGFYVIAASISTYIHM